MSEENVVFAVERDNGETDKVTGVFTTLDKAKASIADLVALYKANELRYLLRFGWRVLRVTLDKTLTTGGDYETVYEIDCNGQESTFGPD